LINVRSPPPPGEVCEVQEISRPQRPCDKCPMVLQRQPPGVHWRRWHVVDGVVTWHGWRQSVCQGRQWRLRHRFRGGGRW